MNFSPKLDQLPAVDWDLCLTLTGNKPATAKELLALLKATLPSTYQQIKAGYEHAQFTQLCDHLHGLYGATCYCGVPALKAITKHFEDLAKAKTPIDQEEMKLVFMHFTHEVERVIEVIGDEYE